MTEEDIRNGYLKHAALAQFHRWYLLYERAESGIDNALDILSPDIALSSGLGEARGHREYAERVTQLPATWENAHFPYEVSVDAGADGTLALTARVTYLNTGMNPDGKVREADLTYTTTLGRGDDLLPKFTSIDIAQNSDGIAGAFRDAYLENRARSLVHYWAAIIEDPKRDPEPAAEILADGFVLNFSSGVITDFEGFRAWLAGPAAAVAASTHQISAFDVSGDDTAFDIRLDFVWGGILPDGTLMAAKTRHSWQVENDVTERFARIRTMNVELLEPFAPVVK